MKEGGTAVRVVSSFCCLNGHVGYYQPIAERCTGDGSAVDFCLEDITVSCGEEMEYRSGVDKMKFGEAIEVLKEGKSVARKGWNGKGMFLYLIKGTEFQNAFKYGYGEYEGEPTFKDSIAIKTAQNTIVVGWKPSNPDMFEEDWEVV